MAPLVKAFTIILCTALLKGTAGDANSTSADKNVEKEANKTVSKREYFLGDLGGWYEPDLALFRAGLHLAEYPFQRYANGAFDIAQQLLQHGIVLENHKGVHQPQELPTSPPRNPKRPVYHYTPLPQGTFPAHYTDEKDERHHDQNYYKQMYYGMNSLRHYYPVPFTPDFGGMAHYAEPSFQNLYFHSPLY